jgi:glutamine amidotransferase
MNLVIIKYNAGNIQSVDFALQRLGIQAQITDDFAAIRSADKVIFPGVGEASSTMKYLQEKGLDKLIPELKQPVLGICLGMQLMCESSEEGNTQTLGIFDTKVKEFQPQPGIKIPHMGWNDVKAKENNLFKVLDKQYVYFVHSYYAPLCNETTLTCEYGEKFTAAMQKDNFYGVQFHPEKSGEVGSKFLNQFLKL